MIVKLEQAIKAIDPKYVTNERLKYERLFQFELYHQIRLLKVDEAELTPEYKKESKYFIENPFSETIGDYIPDLLIHNINNKTSQNLAIEIKSITKNGMDNIYFDIKKLMCYCHKTEGALNYKIGILILFDGDFLAKFRRARKYGNEIRELYRYSYNPVEIWVVTNDLEVNKYNKDNITTLCT